MRSVKLLMLMKSIIIITNWRRFVRSG